VKGKIDAIVTAYKERFQQQSVGVVMRPACVSFWSRLAQMKRLLS
jgi:hypothetical protein